MQAHSLLILKPLHYVIWYMLIFKKADNEKLDNTVCAILLAKIFKAVKKSLVPRQFEKIQ